VNQFIQLTEYKILVFISYISVDKLTGVAT